MARTTTALQRALGLLAVLAFFAGCHGGSSTTFVPHGGGGSGATPTPTPAPGGSGVIASAAQVNAAAQSVENMYVALPHTSVDADLSALAAQMVASGQFSSAVVNPGGITAKLPSGATEVFFADVPADLGATTSSARTPHAARPSGVRVATSATAAPRRPATVSQSSTNGVAILVDTIDPAFNPTLQQSAANAFTAVFGQATGYASTYADISLANIVSLGQLQQLDFLVLNTHGMVIGLGPIYDYAMSSSTSVNDVDSAIFQSDLTNGDLVYSTYLTIQATNFTLAQYAFTPRFLTARLHFNPGAIVFADTCLGASPLIASGVDATYQAAGVGRYYGWTKAVINAQGDQSEVFLIQRMLGDWPSITGLQDYVSQFVPPQRPFDLDDVDAVMKTEDRSSNEVTKPYPYTISDGYAPNASMPPTADGTQAKLVIADFGGEGVANPPIEYAFPSIERMAVTAESSSGGTLQIMGDFPPAPGTVTVTDNTGTTTFKPTSWTTTSITVTLPASGKGSAGQVAVVAANLPSNAVPLTQWSGTLDYSETNTLTEMAAESGGGNGTFTAHFVVNFRADVHPFVATIDEAPVQQNFTFPQLQFGSTGTATSYAGAFDDGSGDSATFGLNASAPVMQVAYPPLAPSTFAMGATPPPIPACNSGQAGPATPNASAFCPGFGFDATDVGTCDDDPPATLCAADLDSVDVGTGGASTSGGVLMLTMDSSYAVSVGGIPAAFSTDHFTPGYKHSATANITGTIGAPSFAPTNDTMASKRRRTR